MTLRQVLEVIWQRRWLVLITLLLVIGVSIAYLQLSSKTYESTAVVRLSNAATAVGGSSSYPGVNLDVDTTTITSTTIMEPAAKELALTGDQITAEELSPLITATQVEGTLAISVQIRALGSAAQESQQRANVVAKTWVGYMQGQVNEGIAAAKARVATASKEVDRLEVGNTSTPTERARFETAYSEFTDATDQLRSLQRQPAPGTLLLQARSGTSTAINPTTVLAAGIVSGLLAGMGVALVRDQFDNRLRSTDAIEDAAGSPVLGEIALDRGRKKGDMTLPAATRRHTAFNESLRALRTSLQVLAPRRHGVIVVTSPEPGDGKSFISANLAVSMARGGRSVIVVGGDLRRPQLGQYFGATSDLRGFANAIEANATKGQLLKLLRPTEYENLRVLPEGSSKKAPADLLATGQLSDVVDRLRGLADVVLIDAPPGLALADAALLAAVSDGVLLLATYGKTSRESLQGTVRVLRANGANIFGVAANRSRRTMPKTYMPYTDTVPNWEVFGTKGSDDAAAEPDEAAASGTPTPDTRDTAEGSAGTEGSGPRRRAGSDENTRTRTRTTTVDAPDDDRDDGEAARGSNGRAAADDPEAGPGWR